MTIAKDRPTGRLYSAWCWRNVAYRFGRMPGWEEHAHAALVRAIRLETRVHEATDQLVLELAVRGANRRKPVDVRTLPGVPSKGVRLEASGLALAHRRGHQMWLSQAGWRRAQFLRESTIADPHGALT